jgi:predicted MFS family arabinose efflux permease
MPVLLVGRAVQGAGGGMIFTLCYSMIVFVYPEKLWSRAMALLSGTWGIATLFGPAVGGIFAELDMWRAGFGVLLPVTALYIFLTSILLPSQLESSGDHSGRIPVLQLMLLAGAVIVLSVGGASSSLALNATGAVLSVVLIYLLVRREQSAKGLLFPNGAFEASSPLFLSLAVMALLIYGVNAEFFMPYFLQVLHGFSPLWAGYVAALVAIGWAGSEVLSARLVGYDMHRAVMAGPLLMVAGMMLLALFTPLTDSPGLLLNIAMGLGLIIVGVGIGIGWPHLSTFALQFTPDDEKESAASALSTVQMFAIAFGTAIAGMIANLAGFNETDGTGGVANAALALFASFGVIALLGVFIARTLIHKHVRKDVEMSEAPASSVSG